MKRADLEHIIRAAADIAKTIAGREKDREFVAAAVRHGLADPDLLRQRLAATEVEPAVRALAASALEALFRA